MSKLTSWKSLLCKNINFHKCWIDQNALLTWLRYFSTACCTIPSWRPPWRYCLYRVGFGPSRTDVFRWVLCLKCVLKRLVIRLCQSLNNLSNKVEVDSRKISVFVQLQYTSSYSHWLYMNVKLLCSLNLRWGIGQYSECIHVGTILI